MREGVPMTPDSVLKAMAEALAKKFTYTPEGAKQERPLEERVHDGMAVGYPTGGYLGTSMRPATCQEAAVEAMNVVGPLLDKLAEVADLLKRSRQALDEMAQNMPDGPTAEYHALSWELARTLSKLEYEEPADWDYVRRFSATPSEIHDILKSGLHPKVYLAYQQAIGKKIAAEVAEKLREAADNDFDREELLFNPVTQALRETVLRCADRVGYETVPEDVVTPES